MTFIIIICLSLLYSIGFAIAYYMLAMYIINKLKANWNEPTENLTTILALGSWFTICGILMIKFIDYLFDRYDDN